MQNKKSQGMVPILIGIVLIAAVFCVGFMTEPENKITGAVSGMEMVSGKACFLPTTPITLPDGTKKQIQNIKVGDKVLSYDLENKKSVVSEVLNVFSHEENEYLIVNDKIKVTPYHMVYAKRLKR